MINNRQNGRRGRGRGGVRPLNGGGGSTNPERGNRIDNRARGNASQLHEKYKTLARDAQTQGDRVMAEYYLQFADHYFRVLSESRNRFDEQRRVRGDFPEEDGDLDGDGGMDGMDARDQRFDDQPYEQQQPRYEPRERQPQPQANAPQRDRPRDDRPRDDRQRDGQRDGQRDDQQRDMRETGNGQAYGGQGNGQAGNGSGYNNNPGGNRETRPDREPRAEREPREARPVVTQAASDAASAAPAVAGEGEAPRRPRGRPRRVVEDAAPRLDGLPPAFLSEGISVARDDARDAARDADGPAAAAEGEDRPRRRIRRPRADEGAPVEV